MSLSFHPLCLSLPDMTPDAFKALVDDVRRNGQLRDIVLYEGMILDGRHRYRACLECKTEPRVVEFSGSDPVAFVISENVARRHLTESQRAMVATQLSSWERGKPSNSATWPNKPQKQSHVAELLGVSSRTIRRASEVRKHGTAQLVTRVESGDLTVTEAAKIAQLGKKSQERILGIEDRQEQRKEVAKALSISQGRKNHGPRTDFIESVEQAPWLVTFMARLEGLIQCAVNAGVDPATLRDRLMNETNWNDSRFAERYVRTVPWLEAIGRLPKEPDWARPSV